MIDAFDYVDGRPALVHHDRRERVPRGAPIIVSGWAIEPGSDAAAEHLCVVVDDRPIAPETGKAREDVAAAEGSAVEVGFRAIVPTDDLVPGRHDVRVYARSAQGAWHSAGHVPFVVYEPANTNLPAVPRRLRLVVEQILYPRRLGQFSDIAAIPQGHPALVVGWALQTSHLTGPAGVVAIDRDGRAWSAPIDVDRADLRPLLGAADERLGFELLIPTDVLGRGRHTLRLTAFDEESRPFEHGVDIVLDIAGPLLGFPHTARESSARANFSAALRQLRGRSTCSGRTGSAAEHISIVRGSALVLEGWALDETGRGAADVFVELTNPDHLIPPHRRAGLAGYRRERSRAAAGGTVVAAPRERDVIARFQRDSGTHPTRDDAPVEDGWFSCPLGTQELRAGSYAFDLLIVEPGRRSLTRNRLGTLTVVDEDSDQD